jgi:hypothetical protein
MGLLAPHKFNHVVARREIKKFGDFLQVNDFFQERECVSVLRTLPNVTALIGTLGAGMVLAEAFKYEFRIQGVVAADLVLANKTKNSAMFIEFGGGGRHSSFARTATNQLPNWSREIEHATGQIIDWAWAIADAGNSAIWESNIGMKSFVAQFFIICGRDGSLPDDLARRRFGFRRSQISVSGSRIIFLTYDELFR